MAKIKTCFICGGACSDRWKVSPKRYICDACYKKIFIRKDKKI